VWRAQDHNGRSWALKEYSLPCSTHKRKFYAQLRSLQQLQHSHIAAVCAVFEDCQHSVFVQMPWYAGGDLAQWLARHPVQQLEVGIEVGGTGFETGSVTGSSSVGAAAAAAPAVVVAEVRQLQQCKQIVQDVLAALAHLHEHGRIHADVKPSNVFLTAAGRAVLGKCMLN
jgi:serine/threonine protein kinase